MRTGVAIAVLIAGGVTFAQRQGRIEQFDIGPVAAAGCTVGHCADGNFDILTDYVFLMTGIIRYDKSGQSVTDRYQYKVMGESVYYNSTDAQKSVAGGPGEVENTARSEDGHRVRRRSELQGQNPWLWSDLRRETGHFVYDDSTGKYVFNSGHNQFMHQEFSRPCAAT